MLPFLRKLAQAMSNDNFEWMLILYTALGLLQIIQYLLTGGTVTYSRHFSLFISQNYVFYPLIGYYFDQRMNNGNTTKRQIILLWMMAFASIAVSCLTTHYKCTLTGNWSDDGCETFFITFIFIPSAAVFITSKAWFTRHPISERSSKVLSSISGTTFGIYLIERICRLETNTVFVFLKPYIHTFPACLVWIFSACVLGCVVVLVLKKIPSVKKFI